MTANPPTASPAQSLADAAQIMKSEDVGSVPVVEDGRLVRVLTDRDIAIHAVAEGVDAQTINVGDLVSREPVTIEPEQDLDEALALMARHQVRRPPVVEAGELVGNLAPGRRRDRGEGEESGRGARADLEAELLRVGAAMPTCEVCGNDYDKAFRGCQERRAARFDSFQCAIHSLAPTCEHCGCRV